MVAIAKSINMFIPRLFISRIFHALLNRNIQFNIGLQEVCSMCQATAQGACTRTFYLYSYSHMYNSLLATILNFNLSFSLGINGIAHSRVHPKANLLQQKIRDCRSFLLNIFRNEDFAFEHTCLFEIVAPFLLFMWHAFRMIRFVHSSAGLLLYPDFSHR